MRYAPTKTGYLSSGIIILVHPLAERSRSHIPSPLAERISNPALDSARAAVIFISCSFPQSIGIGICWKGIDWTTESGRLCSSDYDFRGFAGFFRVHRSALSPN